MDGLLSDERSFRSPASVADLDAKFVTMRDSVVPPWRPKAIREALSTAEGSRARQRARSLR
jgi:hypothetical protein